MIGKCLSDEKVMTRMIMIRQVMSKQLSCCGKCNEPGRQISKLKRENEMDDQADKDDDQMLQSVVLVRSVAKYVRRRHPGAQISDRRVLGVSLGPTYIHI